MNQEKMNSKTESRAVKNAGSGKNVMKSSGGCCCGSSSPQAINIEI